MKYRMPRKKKKQIKKRWCIFTDLTMKHKPIVTNIGDDFCWIMPKSEWLKDKSTTEWLKHKNTNNLLYNEDN